jgi:hypothetical protein
MPGRAFVLLLAALGTAPITRAQSSNPIEAFEKSPDGRVYFVGRPVDAILLPDGSVAYLLEWPSGTPRDSDSPWVLIAHPVPGGVTTPIDPITGRRVAIGTDPDGIYHGFAWFVGRVPNVVESADDSSWTPLYETHQTGLEEPHAERAMPSPPLQGAAVQKWWAEWDEWLEKLSAADHDPHIGIVSSCRETEEGIVVTMKGDGTFEFLCRDRDRITYEGLPVSAPCDVVGQRVVVWTLPCDGGPCIRKIQAGDGPTPSPKPPTAESVSNTPAPHPGLITGCRPGEGSTVVTVKGNGTFQFLHRSRDRVVYEGVEAGSPCELVGRNVVVWTVACEEDAPCISKVAIAP